MDGVSGLIIAVPIAILPLGARLIGFPAIRSGLGVEAGGRAYEDPASSTWSEATESGTPLDLGRVAEAPFV